MRWLSAVAVCLVLTSVSGCLEADAGGADDDTSSSSTTSTSRAPGSTSATGTTTSAPAEASLANATANLTASVLNGTAPLNVTFQLNGTAPGDLSWTLLVNGTELANGTALPANVTHVFNQTGNVTVVLTVSGASGNATANVTLAIAAGAAPDAVLADPTRCDRSATAVGGEIYIFDGDGGTWLFAETNGIDGLQVGNTHPAEATGQAETLGFHNAAWDLCENGDQQLF